MLWLIVLGLSNILLLRINGFIMQDTFNVMLKDDKKFKVDLVITADDIEMIHKNQLKPFKIAKEAKKFSEIYKMARKAYCCTKKITPKSTKTPHKAAFLPIIVVKGNEHSVMTTYLGAGPSVVTTEGKREIKVHSQTEYDYDNLVNEYYNEAESESRSDNAFHIRNSVFEISEYGTISALKRIFLISGNSNCSEDRGIGLVALMCLYNDYTQERQPMNDVLGRLRGMFLIWFIIYLIIAIPLWCTRGWCCCCLRCKFFKPKETIEEAKKYVVLYPPGIFKTKTGLIYYEPTEREKECYEEFEHFIKTL